MAMEKRLELLSPAGDWERLEMALAYGADAVYLAGDTFGMRAFAGNFSQEDLPRAAALCREKDWLLLVDEVQTGIGRTGTLFAFQQFGIQPDVVSFAKGIAGGLPLGGILTNEKCSTVLTPGTHGSTFGANPVSTAAGMAVLETLDQTFLDGVKEKGAYLRAGIEAIGSPYLGQVVGMGLMLGIDITGGRTNKEVASLLMDHGLLCLTAGDRLRLLPPLVITKDEMDQGLAILKQTLMD